ncbi:hypothetical protein Golob_007694, partial [Gossypium lobatum]|nr:hypothetical protein [Gossypium lobatum]
DGSVINFWNDDWVREVGHLKYYFNGHGILDEATRVVLQSTNARSRGGSEYAAMIYVELWVQIHDLSLGLMSEAMVRQFGSFLGSFLDYDPKILMYYAKRYMRIKDISLRALVRRKSSLVSRWLRKPDETMSQRLDKNRSMNWYNFWDNIMDFYPNRNQNLVRSIRFQSVKVKERVSNWENNLNINEPNDSRLIKLGSDGEECPIQFVDKKKRQRTLGVTSVDLFNGDVGVVGEGQDRSASSAM